MNKSAFISLLCFLISLQLWSQTQLPALFSDGMVLQQQQQVSIWGTDKPYMKINVSGSWGKTAMAITDDNGHWKLKLQTPSAGGPFTIMIKGNKTVTLKNVLIGEVWFCSGQSNMEMPMKGFYNQPVLGSNEAILNSANDKIRMFTNRRTVNISPMYEMNGEWKAAGTETTGNFSATAYYFARKLQKLLGVPVGIIHSSWGGSTIESWMDKETLSAFPNVIIPDEVPQAQPNRTPTILYNSLLHPYIGFTMKGVLWYQGESNRENANEYQSMFTALISSWRKQWKQSDFPFYFVQIAPFDYPKLNAAFLREAQLKTMQSVKNTGMAVIMDIGDQKNIHPSQKEEVGSRLAYWALAKDYNIKGVSFSGPVYKDMQINNNGRINLTFDYSEQGLTSFGKPLTDFEIAGDDKIFYPANATIINNEKIRGLSVWSDSVKNPVAVRYAFKNWVEGSLYNTQGLPASSFRTDNW